jgi:hypothetical protein
VRSKISRIANTRTEEVGHDCKDHIANAVDTYQTQERVARNVEVLMNQMEQVLMLLEQREVAHIS